MAQNTLTSDQVQLQSDAAVSGKIGLTTHLRWAITDTIVLARRNLTQIFRQPELVVFALIQPVIFTLLFAFVFGGAIQTPGGDYLNYLIPGIIIQTVVFAANNTAIGLTDDLSKGMIDRFRSLPMSRAAVLAGRTLADALRSLITMSIIVTVGLIIGFRPEGGPAGVILGLAIAMAFGYAFTWIFALVGMLVKSPETAQLAGFISVFPLVFASSIFVPPASIQYDWLRWFAEHQPISVIANAVRGSFLGLESDPLGAMLWIIGILLVFVPLAVRQYSRTVN